MTFEDHLEQCRNDDGSYDLNAAEQARAEELAENTDEIDRLAVKAARAERLAWERKQRDNLGKQFQQPALSPELDVDAMVQIGDSTVLPYGEMDLKRIQLRKDLRTKVHLDENRAYDAEMTHWFNTIQLLADGETIAQALGRIP